MFLLIMGMLKSNLNNINYISYDKFLLIKPLNDYINKALEGYKIPDRKA